MYMCVYLYCARLLAQLLPKLFHKHTPWHSPATAAPWRLLSHGRASLATSAKGAATWTGVEPWHGKLGGSGHVCLAKKIGGS